MQRSSSGLSSSAQTRGMTMRGLKMPAMPGVLRSSETSSGTFALMPKRRRVSRKSSYSGPLHWRSARLKKT